MGTILRLERKRFEPSLGATPMTTSDVQGGVARAIGFVQSLATVVPLAIVALVAASRASAARGHHSLGGAVSVRLQA
jgi:hypothetical protein